MIPKKHISKNLKREKLLKRKKAKNENMEIEEKVEDKEEDVENDEFIEEEKEEKEINHKEPEPIKNAMKKTNEIGEDEYDEEAYEMLHRATTLWPCLSIDFILEDRLKIDEFLTYNPYKEFPKQCSKEIDDEINKRKVTRHIKDKYPYDLLLVGGNQSSESKYNAIYVMRWKNLDKYAEDMEDEDFNPIQENPNLLYNSFQHKGSVNRVRSMNGTPIIATWSDQKNVYIYNVYDEILKLQEDKTSKTNKIPKTKKPLFAAKFKEEGYALDWSYVRKGLLAVGGHDNQIHLIEPTGKNWNGFQVTRELNGHKHWVEDIQFSPSEDNVLASASVDKSIKIWDTRNSKEVMTIIGHESDVNVISWNHMCQNLLSSGSDDKSFKIWDLRNINEPLTNIIWHNAPICSIQFQPRIDYCCLAVASRDNKISIWDFSAEIDEEGMEDLNSNYPPSLMFLHEGQSEIKEIRFHPYYENMIVSTSETGIDIFRPDFEPKPSEDSDEEDKSTNQKSKEEELANNQEEDDKMQI